MAASNFELLNILLWAGFVLLVLSAMVIGACLYHLWMKRTPKARRSSHPQSGNVFFALFALVGMMALLGTALTNFMQGPVSSVSNVTRSNIAQNDMQAAVAVIAQASLVAPGADCDDDGFIEPLPFRDAGAAPAPSGGGLLPLDVGVNRRDPWGTDYAYCVWDHGEKVLDAACGGAGASRRVGGDTKEAAAIAVISAGPDKIFQTICEDWIDNETDIVNKPSGSDDIGRIIPYAQMVSASSANAQLQELPDEACTESTIGIMRLFLESPQICLEEGWTEIGGVAVQSAGDFNDITGAEPASADHLSGTVSFSGFRGTRPLTVQGGASLLINGNPVTPPAAISEGDTIELRADAPSSPGETSTFSILMSGIRKEWTIETRAAYPPDLRISPTTTNMTVQGPGNPAYGTPEGFLVSNLGERSTQTLLPAYLSNSTNFEFFNSGSFHGDDCAGKALAGGDSCVVDIRPKATTGISSAGTLDVTDGVSTVSANLNISASGWTCSLPWGGTINDGNSVVAYLSDNIACGGSCTSETRTCSGGVLSGSYTRQSCNASANCSYSWYTGSYGSCSASPYWGSWGSYGSCSKSCGGGTQSRSRSCLGRSGTETRTVYCRRSDGQTVSNSYCSGGAPASSRSCTGSCSGSSTQSRSCNTHACCSGGGSCTPHSSGPCAGHCGGSGGCPSTWTSTTCPSGCRKVMQSPTRFTCEN